MRNTYLLPVRLLPVLASCLWPAGSFAAPVLDKQSEAEIDAILCEGLGLTSWHRVLSLQSEEMQTGC